MPDPAKNIWQTNTISPIPGKPYKLIKSALGGIYRALVGLDDEKAIAILQKDLQYEPFRESIEAELKKVFSDESILGKADGWLRSFLF